MLVPKKDFQEFLGACFGSYFGGISPQMQASQIVCSIFEFFLEGLRAAHTLVGALFYLSALW